MAIKGELLDQLLEGYQKPEDLLGEGGIFQELNKALVKKALGAEPTHHLGYEKEEKAGRAACNIRNGHGKNKVKGQDGEMVIAVPRCHAKRLCALADTAPSRAVDQNTDLNHATKTNTYF